MKLEVKPRETAPKGTSLAIGFKIVDLGTQFNETFGNTSRKFHFYWELPDELMTTGKPFAVKNEYSLAMGKKAKLIQHFEPMLGKKIEAGFDPATALDVPCNLALDYHTAANGNVYEKVTAVTGLIKGQQVPKRTNPILIFDLDKFNQAIFDALPEFEKEIIKKSPEYHEAVNGKTKPPADDLNDDIPFGN